MLLALAPPLYKTRSSFPGVSSGHGIISAKIRRNKELSLQQKKKQAIIVLRYSRSSITNCDTSNEYTVTTGNNFDTLQKTSESHTTNEELKNFFTKKRKQLLNTYQTYQKPNVEFHMSQ